MWAGIEQAARSLPDVGVPQEIVQILQGTLLLSAVIAFEVVRRYGQARGGAGGGRQGRRRCDRDSAGGSGGIMTADRDPARGAAPKRRGFLDDRRPLRPAAPGVAVGGLARAVSSPASSPTRDDLTAGATFIAAIGAWRRSSSPASAASAPSGPASSTSASRA